MRTLTVEGHVFFFYRRLKQYSSGVRGDRVTMRPFQQCNPPLFLWQIYTSLPCLFEEKKKIYQGLISKWEQVMPLWWGPRFYQETPILEPRQLLEFPQQSLGLPCIIHRPYFHFLDFVEQSRISDIKPWNYKLLKPPI